MNSSTLHSAARAILVATCTALTASAQTSVYLDADTPATGSLLQTQPLVTPLGTITFLGEVRLTSDPELAAAGSVGNVFDIIAPNSDALMSFDFDVSSITFIYGGNTGGILLEARDAAGAVVDSFFQASTNTGQPAGPETLMGVGIRALYWVDPGANFAAIDNVTIDTAGGGLGTSYCGPAANNSTGSPGTLAATGSALVATNDVTLVASALPMNSFGFFLASRTAGFVANPGGSQGNLCLGSPIGRYVGPGQIQNSGAIGSFSLALDLAVTPQPSGSVAVVAGETWRYQSWYRDAVGGVATSNFTDGLEIAYQ
jgi:hypothetical protein